jgi:CDP-diacylglycerol---glycerol-3-phosphate 3-phosphatidyltransferase
MVAIVGILIMQYLQELINLSVMPSFTVGQFSSSTVFWFAGNVLVGISTLFTIISGAIYLKQNWNLFKNSK